MTDRSISKTQIVICSLTILDTDFNANEATIDGHLTLNQNIRVGAVSTICTNLWMCNSTGLEYSALTRKVVGSNPTASTIFISDAPYTIIRR